MADENFYPSLSQLIPTDALPDNLGLLGNAAHALDGLFYRNLQANVSSTGDHGSYHLIVVSYRKLGLVVPGTEIGIFLNPAATGDGGSEFPVSFSYTWELLRYTSRIDLSQFDFSPRAFFDLLLNIAGVSYSDLINEVVATFTNGTLDDFVNRFNAAHPSTPITVAPDPDPDVFIDNIVDALETHSLGVINVIFDDYIADVDPNAAVEKLEHLFSTWLGSFSTERLRRLLLPELTASIDKLAIGVQIPAAILREVDAAGNPVTNPEDGSDEKPVLISCDAASVHYSTDDGVTFDVAENAVITVPRSEVLRSGLILDIHQIKLDVSRTTNIPEATADGRPMDFVGVYIKDGTISFPLSWRPQSDSTAVIKARNLLLGTGGISGTLALEAQSAGTPSPVVKLVLGDNFRISLDTFQLTFKQNAITSSVIEGTLVIPGFKDSANHDAEIKIKVDIRGNGDFDVTAHEDQGFKEIEFPGVFAINVKSVFFGKKDDDFYIGVSGSIRFTHDLLKDLIKDPIDVEKLLIWSDGRFEIEGGTIPLPNNLRFPIGPAEISISAIHLGSHDRVNPDGSITKFRYFGFDGAIDVNPGGVDARGKGIKFYFPVDLNLLNQAYLEIKSLAIDLVIPGSASKETATLLVSGFLSVGGDGGDPEYTGGVSFSLPKVKIAGGAEMRYRPKDPAFLVNAFVELSTPIPLGATSLGIYGFRGLFGQRYIATKTAAGLDESASWFDYYKAEPQGVVVQKFEQPGKTAGYDSTMSIGAGVSLATAADSGKAFSSRLFLLLSLPDLIYLEGRANIVGERVGLTGNDDPPFFAVLAITPQSVELGAGVNYKLPRATAEIVELSAEMRAAFYFHNSSAWFIHVGTPQNPTTARILTLFDATSYLMLSASGIAAGAGVTYGFDKSYAGGLVHASVGVYIKVGGFISFERPQIGGFAMLGGHVDVAFLWLSFYISIDTTLSVEVPQPFYIQGSVSLCVGVTIGFWKFKKRIERCFTVEFKWTVSTTVNRDPVLPIAGGGALPPASATNMLSGETFHVAFLGTTPPSPSDPGFDQAVLPLDTWVDIEFLKGLIPSMAVDARIARLSGEAPANATEAIPPAEVAHKVTHQYSINACEISAWNGTAWVEYRPYQAMSPPAALAALAAHPADYKDGFWVNNGGGFNKIRLLSETSLSYANQSGAAPEEFGIISASLFCSAQEREEHCIDWRNAAAGSVRPTNRWTQFDTALYRIADGDGTVVDWTGLDGPSRSLLFDNDDSAQFVFNKPCATVRIRLTTFSTGVTIRYYQRVPSGPLTAYTPVETRNLTQVQLLAPVVFDRPDAPVARIEIEPLRAEPSAVAALQIEILRLERLVFENQGGQDGAGSLIVQIQQKKTELTQLQQRGCNSNGLSTTAIRPVLDSLKQQSTQCSKELKALQLQRDDVCEKAAELEAHFHACLRQVPSQVSYDIVAEPDTVGRQHYRFVVYDDEKDTVLQKSAQLFDQPLAAELAFFSGVQQILPSITVPPVRRTDGRLPCPHCGGDFDCWRDLVVTDESRAVVPALDYLCEFYTRLYRRLYAETLKKLDDLRQQCAALTAQAEQKLQTCRALSKQVAAAQHAVDALGPGAALHPPEGFPCCTLLHEVCWLTSEDRQFNVTIPGRDAVEQDYTNAVDAIEKRLTPIWRPGTRYTIHLQVQDTVDGSPKPAADFYFGFRTAGPVPFFHTDPSVTYVKTGKSPDQYQLTGLKGYIDYARSYPNADGDLVRAKPLFYDDPRILLFFTKRYVYHFFGDWPTYNGLAALGGNAMQVVIKDPSEKASLQNPPPPIVTTIEVPRAVVDWPTDDDPRIPEDVRMLLHLRNPVLLNPAFSGATCWTTGGQMIKPASVYTIVTPQNLRPLKLYTAIVNNVFGQSTAETHRYVFQTSRYRDFKEQVNSYHLEDAEGNEHDAVFPLNFALTPADVALLYDIVSGNMSAANAALASRWADPFDRIIEAVLKQAPLDAATGTEINVVRNTNTNLPVALWIRNPEPFNDPKLSAAVLARTLRVVQGSAVNPAYTVLFAKDGAQAFVMHPSRRIPANRVKLRFAYVEWDGSTYVDRTIVTTSFIPTTP